MTSVPAHCSRQNLIQDRCKRLCVVASNASLRSVTFGPNSFGHGYAFPASQDGATVLGRLQRATTAKQPNIMTAVTTKKAVTTPTQLTATCSTLDIMQTKPVNITPTNTARISEVSKLVRNSRPSAPMSAA